MFLFSLLHLSRLGCCFSCCRSLVFILSASSSRFFFQTLCLYRLAFRPLLKKIKFLSVKKFYIFCFNWNTQPVSQQLFQTKFSPQLASSQHPSTTCNYFTTGGRQVISSRVFSTFLLVNIAFDISLYCQYSEHFNRRG